MGDELLSQETTELMREALLFQGPGGVLQDWVTLAPWKCQSVLLSGMRGPDHALCPHVKEVTRWMRKISQRDADPNESYMAPRAIHVHGMPTPSDLKKELEFSSGHFIHHFSQALRVIHVFHPDEDIADYAGELHYYIARELFHFLPEDASEFIERLADKAGK